MFKFFRKIRKEQLIENRTGKYLAYALGEIVLVVIGILIALSINTWNQGRIDRQEEIIVLTNIQKEIEMNIAQNNSIVSNRMKKKSKD